MWTLWSRRRDLLQSRLVVRTRQGRRRCQLLTLWVGISEWPQSAVLWGWVRGRRQGGLDRSGGAWCLRGAEAGQEGNDRGAEKVAQLGGAEDADRLPVVDEEEEVYPAE